MKDTPARTSTIIRIRQVHITRKSYLAADLRLICTDMAANQELDCAFCHVQLMWQCWQLTTVSSCWGLRLLQHAKHFINSHSHISKTTSYEHWGCGWSHLSVGRLGSYDVRHKPGVKLLYFCHVTVTVLGAKHHWLYARTEL